MQVIRKSYDRGDPYCIIFEDDIVATKYFTREKLDKVKNFLETNKEWNLFYLGFVPDFTRGNSLLRKDGMMQCQYLCCHAYILSRAFMKRVKDSEYDGIPLDFYLPNVTDKSFSLPHVLLVQGAYGSDIGPFRGNDLVRWMTAYVIPWYSVNINMNVIELCIIVAIGFIVAIGVIMFGPSYRFGYLMVILFLMVLTGYIIKGYTIQYSKIQDTSDQKFQATSK